MGMRHLLCLSVVADSLLLARLGKQLHIERPLLSYIIKELENEFDMTKDCHATRRTCSIRAGAHAGFAKGASCKTSVVNIGC